VLNGTAAGLIMSAVALDSGAKHRGIGPPHGRILEALATRSNLGTFWVTIIVIAATGGVRTLPNTTHRRHWIMLSRVTGDCAVGLARE